VEGIGKAMYESYWNLSGSPFENWGEEQFYFPSEVHETALLQMQYMIEGRRAAVALCGDCGMGKSLLTEMLADRLSESESPIARVVFPQLSGEQLLGYIADELTGQCGPTDEPPRMTLRRLSDFLGENVDQNRHAVLVVDEAHLLNSPDQLETLRLLLNLRHDRHRGEAAITLVLVGQTTLLTNIERFRALDDRVATKCLLNRFTAAQTADYVQHRLRQVGGVCDTLFSPEAIETLHLRAMGIPRRINRLADLALMVGFAEETQRVEVRHIEGVHQELVAA
jgi:general secretion pathway protein A